MGALSSRAELDPLSILQVVPSLGAGGAETLALQLHRGYRDRGHASMLLLGRGPVSPQEDVFAIPDRWHSGAWPRWVGGFRGLLSRISGGRPLSRMQPFFDALAFPRFARDLAWGHEDFSYPSSQRILGLGPRPPNILHLHNLHGQWVRREGFFDLRALIELSRKVPTILAPHDPWLLTGHCAHPMGCPRWRIGCGQCPDLGIYPTIRRDGTAYNWRRKRAIFQRAQLYLATPSQWLMDMFEESGIRFMDRRVIRNGVDVNCFCPNHGAGGRETPRLDIESKVVLVVANHLQSNPWKGFDWVRETALRLSNRRMPFPVNFVCVGDEGISERWGNVRLSFVPMVHDPETMARIYQESDVLLHPSRADTFPLVVLEGMSSGLPVVATEVGGIPEQIEDQASGFLVRPGDVEAMTDRVQAILTQPSLGRAMGSRGREIVMERFNLERQIEAYLEWYQVILRGYVPHFER